MVSSNNVGGYVTTRVYLYKNVQIVNSSHKNFFKPTSNCSNPSKVKIHAKRNQN